MSNKPIQSPKITKYKKQLHNEFSTPEPKSIETDSHPSSEAKTWAVSRDHGALTVNFITNDDEQGFPYTYLQRWRMTLQGDVHLKFSEGLVIIKGKELRPLYKDICRYRLIELSIDKFTNGTEVDDIEIKLNDEVLK